MAIRAVFLDCDGVLAETEPLHLRAFQAALAERGIALSERDYRKRLLGLDDRACAEAALGDPSGNSTASDVESLLLRKQSLYWGELDRGVPAVPGVVRFLRGLEPRYRLAVVSGARRMEVDRIIAHLGIGDLLATRVAAEDVRSGKPDPAPYLLALERSRASGPVEAAECVAVEDSPVGIRAALAAGMRVIGLTTTFAPVDLTGAHAVAASFKELDEGRLQAL